MFYVSAELHLFRQQLRLSRRKFIAVFSPPMNHRWLILQSSQNNIEFDSRSIYNSRSRAASSTTITLVNNFIHRRDGLCFGNGRDWFRCLEVLQGEKRAQLSHFVGVARRRTWVAWTLDKKTRKKNKAIGILSSIQPKTEKWRKILSQSTDKLLESLSRRAHVSSSNFNKLFLFPFLFVINW